jgi:hypothetical protein
LLKAEIRPQKGKRDHHAVLANRLLSGYYRGAKEKPVGEISGMPDSQAGALKEAINAVLKSTKAQGRAARAARAEQYCRDIASRDYDLALRQHFDPPQLRQILREIQRTLPTLNREVYRITDLGRLAGIASKLGVVFQDHAFPGAEGAGFRGFYVNEAESLKTPLIWVNTAAPAPAAAAAFWHEIGHHLTAHVWSPTPDANTAFSTSGSHDFSDPKEIAADLVRVLGGYPKVIAERVLGGPDMEQARYDADLLVGKAVAHVRSIMRFALRNRASAQENLLYLGGMIHTAKLRMTLLSQYGI